VLNHPKTLRPPMVVFTEELGRPNRLSLRPRGSGGFGDGGHRGGAEHGAGLGHVAARCVWCWAAPRAAQRRQCLRRRCCCLTLHPDPP
jgi:hypothetical protein